MDKWIWKVGWDWCATALLIMAAGLGISGYLASRHAKDSEQPIKVWRKGLFVPLSQFTRIGQFYKLVSYGFSVAAVIVFVVCYLSPTAISGLGLSGFRLGLTLFLLFSGAATIVGWIAAFRYSEGVDNSVDSGRVFKWSWAWDASPSLTPEGQRMRLLALSLVGLGFVAMILSTLLGS